MEERKNKLMMLGIIILFFVGFLLGKTIQKDNNKPRKQYGTNSNQVVAVDEDTKENENEVDANSVMVNEVVYEVDERAKELLTFSHYYIQNPNDSNKDCSISLGDYGNFSLYVSENEYIYGNYKIDGNNLVCTAVTYRDSDENIIDINTVVTFRIVDKVTLQVVSVEFDKLIDSPDSTLIKTSGLRAGMRYKYEK